MLIMFWTKKQDSEMVIREILEVNSPGKPITNPVLEFSVKGLSTGERRCIVQWW